MTQNSEPKGVHFIEKKGDVKHFETLAKHTVQKKGGQPPESQGGAVFDISPSMRPLFSQDYVYAIATAVLGTLLVFDDDGKVPYWAMNSGAERMPGFITRDNLQSSVRALEHKISGGTNYAPTIHKILEDIQRRTFLQVNANGGAPGFVPWFTDGNNFDERETVDAVIMLSYYPLFLQFIGIALTGEGSFTFLKELDEKIPVLAPQNFIDGTVDECRVVDNVGFSSLTLSTLKDITLVDVLVKEYVQYPARALGAGLMPWNTLRPFKQQKEFVLNYLRNKWTAEGKLNTPKKFFDFRWGR